jgi:hypothetical protein
METENSSQMPSFWARNAYTLIAWVAVIVIAALVGGYWYYDLGGGVPERQTPAAQLTKTSAAFAQANDLYLVNDFKGAQAKYEESLSVVQNPAQEAQVKLRIAHAVRDQGDNVRAVQLYKEIVQNKAYPNITRAYAMQSVAVLADFIRDPALREEIFKTRPFSLFEADDKNITVSNRRLFEYAAYLHPLAFSEMQVALWYADRLRVNALAKGAMSEEKKVQYRDIVTERMRRADLDLEHISNDPNSVVLVPETLRSRALTLSSLYFAGYASRAEADKAYLDAFEANARYGAPGDGNMRLWYAYYLASFDDRHDELISIVAPIYTDPTYRPSRIGTFLAAERDNLLDAKKPLVDISAIDPKFRDFLLSLGWEQSDFAS